MSFRKFAAAKIIEAEKITLDNWRKNVIAASIKQDPKVVEASPSFDVDENGFVYVRVRAVSAMEHYGPNGNGDGFPEEELQQNYKTFIRRGNYLNHQSDDISKAVGIILDAKYWTDPGTYYVECLLAVDKSEPIADKIVKGIADSVSMGAIVDRCHCSVCDKVATCEADYCDHLKNYMGKEYNGRKVYAINRGVNFYELSWVSVPADKDAKLLERVASQEAPKTDPRFDRMVKMADAFQTMKKEAEPENKVNDDKKPKPKPPTPPKKEDKDLEQIVDSVVQKEVDRGMESELVARVRDALKKLQLKQKVQREVSDEEILQSVREEISKKTKEPVLPIESALHQAVNAKLEKIEKEAEGTVLKLNDTYAVHVYGKVAGKAVAQLLKEGKATGLYTRADEKNSVDYYKEKFAIASEKNELSEPDNSNQVEDLQVKSNLVIRYVPHESDLSKCAFVARKGNLEVRQSASKLLSEAVQKAIVASEQKEAAGKVEHGSDYDAAKGKVDVKIQEGKEKIQPADVTKNLGGTDDAGDYDATKGKVDVKQQEGKEPIQPAQVVQKFATQVGGKVTKLAEDKKSGVVTAEVEGGSIARIAQLWGSKASLVKEAELSHEPGAWSREFPKPVDTSMTADKTAWSFEQPDRPGKPAGNRGASTVKYFGQYDKADLTGTPDAWARKVASLNKELIQAKAEKKMLEAALSKERNEKIAEKKASLVSEIMSRMVEANALAPDMGEVLEWKEKGLEHDDAVAKVAALAQDRQKRELFAMDVAALEQMKKTISRFAVSNNRTSELENPKSVDVPFVGTDTSTGPTSMEDKLSAGW